MTESISIGEIVEIKDNSGVIAELYTEDISIIKDSIFKSNNNEISTIYICERLFREPIDKERRIVALNLPYEEIIKKYPQEKLLIKNYAYLYIAGSISEGKFLSSVQVCSIGVHNRIYPFNNDEYMFFINNENALFSLLLSIYNNKNIIPSVKPIFNKLIEIDSSGEFAPRLYKAITTIFRNDYMLIRDIISILPK